MEKLLGTLAFSKVPKVERSRKREHTDPKRVSVEKKPKLLEDILNGSNPSSLVPSYTTNGIEITKEKSGKWKTEPLPIAKRDSIGNVRHWKKEGTPIYEPPKDIALHPTSVIEYTENEYETAKCRNEQWTKEKTDYLFKLCRTYNLRWPVIVDMMSTCSTFNLETCQLRFYTVSKLILGQRQQQGCALTSEEEIMLYHNFDTSFCKNRRQAIDRSFMISNICNNTEKILYDRLRAIDNQLNRICNIDITEGYGPHDDLDSIPTVMKEKPVYLKPKPGVTLRSDRFDNNSASAYFADGTQKRLIQILAEMNVQIPRMATKRICDTLDRLKQDIVKLIMLRKYLDQNNYTVNSSRPVVYQNNDTKKKRKAMNTVSYTASNKNYTRYVVC